MKEVIKSMEGEDMTLWKHMARFITKHIGAMQVKQAARAMEGPGIAGAVFKREDSGGFAAAAANPPTLANPSPTAVAGGAGGNGGVSGSGIIYVSKREDCHTVAGELRKLHIAAAAYHAGLPVKERSEVQQKWMDNNISCIVATNAFGMGIDKARLRAQTLTWQRTCDCASCAAR